MASKLEQIEGTICQLETSRESLLRQLAEVDKRLEVERAQYAQLRNELVPIHSLPNELLAFVFADAHALLRANPSGKADLAALRFLVETSRVCLRWRQVILHTPLLWNTLVMTVTSGFKGNIAAQEYLKAHLRRSNDAFLDMIVYADTEDPSDLNLFFDTITPHAARWRRFSIEMRCADINMVRPHFANLDAPKLRHLSFNVCGTPEGRSFMSPRAPYPTISPQIFLNGLPELSVLRLANASISNLHPQSTSIQTLHIGGWESAYFTWVQLKSLLESLPQLQNLSLHDVCVRHNTRDPLDQPSPIHLPELRSIRVHKPFTPIDRILPLLTVPKLEGVSLYDMEYFDCTEIPSVKHLLLQASAFDELHFEHLFAAFPNVEDLTVDGDAYQLYEAALNQLPKHPWRTLRRLTVHELTATDVVAFALLVLKRKQAGVPLTTVRLDKKSRHVLRVKGKLDLLTEHVDVVPYDEMEVWPPGRGYDDPHDLV